MMNINFSYGLAAILQSLIRSLLIIERLDDPATPFTASRNISNNPNFAINQELEPLDIHRKFNSHT